MKIHAEGAFRILEFFRRHGTVLDFGGRILEADPVTPTRNSVMDPG